MASFSRHALTAPARYFSAPFCCQSFGVVEGLSKINLDRVTEHISFQARQLVGTSRVNRNRILLCRAMEEAEGYSELGMSDHALSALQRRGALVHGDGRACYLLGEVFRELARYEEALLPLERSSDLLPDDVHVLLALGWCYKRTGQLAKAIHALERAVTIEPGEAVLHYNLACYWSLARNRALAIGYLSRALEIDGNFRDMVSDEADFNPIRHDAEFIALTSVIV
jgi:tetratricopeptide (TPR) repeat protein